LGKHGNENTTAGNAPETALPGSTETKAAHRPPARFGTRAEHPMKTTHILKSRSGPVVTGTFDETTAAFSCEWEPWPLTSEQLHAVLPEYEAWRDAIFEDWSRRTGLRVLLVTL
jgi:hypothetical protein